MLFSLEAGGREIWRSAMIGIDTPPVRVEAPLSGAKDVVLKAWDINEDNNYTLADWADVELELADGTTARLGASTASFLPLPPDATAFGVR